MKTKIITLLLFAFSLTSMAQNASKAKELLDDVSAKVASYDNIYLTFDYILDNEQENIHQETNGNVKIAGDQYHLNFMGIERIYDGKKVYTIVHEDEEVVISNGDSDDESDFTPSKILTFYKKGYKFEWDQLKKIGGKNIQFIKLIPIASNSDVKYILLGIDTKSKNIYQVVYTGNKHTLTTFKIRLFKTNNVFPPKEFIFDEAKYKAKDYIITRI